MDEINNDGLMQSETGAAHREADRKSPRLFFLPKRFGKNFRHGWGDFFGGRDVEREQTMMQIFQENGYQVVHDGVFTGAEGEIGWYADQKLIDRKSRTDNLAQVARLETPKVYDRNDIQKLPYPIVVKDELDHGGDGIYLIKDYDTMLKFVTWSLMGQTIMMLQHEPDPIAVLNKCIAKVRAGKYKGEWFFHKEIPKRWSFQEYEETPSDYYTSIRIVADANGKVHYGSLKRSLHKKGEVIKKNARLLGEDTTPLTDINLQTYRDYLLEHPDSPFFLNSPMIVSNAYQGGPRLFLNGEKAEHPMDRQILRDHDINPDNPQIPKEMLEKASIIGRAAAGVYPYVGIDFIMDKNHRDREILLEANVGSMLSPEGLGINPDEISHLPKEGKFSEKIQEYCEKVLLTDIARAREQEDVRVVPESIDYTISARSFEWILEDCKITKESILALRPNAVIVEAGSGLYQEFAAGVKAIRPDIQVISIDPTLAFSPMREDIQISESGDSISYNSAQKPLSKSEIRKYQLIQMKRTEHARQVGQIDLAIAPDFLNTNIKTNSVDLWVDSYGAILYLKKEEIRRYVEKVYEFLRTAGTAHLYPIGFLALLQPFHDQDEIQVAPDLIQKIIDPNLSINRKFYAKDRSIGMIFEKRD